MEIFRELAVKVNGLESAKGSGCIYELSNESGKKYILTAQHCLSSDKQKRVFNHEDLENIEIYDFDEERINIFKIHIPENPELDFAIIEARSSKTYKKISIKHPKRGLEYTFFGFPKYLQNDLDSGELLEGYISEVKKSTITLQHHSGALSDADNDAIDNTKGFSGSGIYCEEDDTYCLIGILIELRGKGAHGKLVGININEINQFLLEKKLEKLYPYELQDFGLHLQLLLKDEDSKLQAIFRKRFSQYIIDLSPNYFHEKLKEKIFLPYNENGNVINSKIWQGWLRFLLYISLRNQKIVNLDNINEYVFVEEPTSSRNRFYFTEEKRMANFVKHLYGSTYKDIRNNDLIFVNSEKFYGSKTPTFNDIHQIIQNIDDPYLFESGIDISNPNELKKVKVIHLDYLVDQIEDELLSCLELNKSLIEIEKSCIQCLEKIFKEFEVVNP
ncbi:MULTISPECIES: ABC-three component system protein [unclassified Exiguobacterium]|uniref:ABC-three component system protein n=1 Tax=unclassified Exiguobacterium TaxID=2644629 RepID=UPI001BE8A1F6|nr:MULTISPECIES: ABC-three component system protein [unclassified Exiguobacterium]